MAWYNKYRPQKFSDVIGQTLVKSVLQNSLEKDRIKHAYLFYGPKGVGKTTLARIFANNLNDIENLPEANIDLIEMDAASNTSIDDVRQLIESAKTPPLVGKYKIYIIDEVHMLSKPAMNALLKILEEPPVYLIFLLATTNPEKLIPTVLSRLTKLNLSSHSTQDIVDTLKVVVSGENLNIDEDSLKLIAKRSSGSLRDAINMLETIASYELEKYTLAQTTELLGLLPEELLLNIAQTLVKGEFVTADAISKLESTSIDGETFLGQFLDFLLTRSFEGDKSFNNIILPIASILDLKLPITSITSSIALVQVKISQSGITQTLKKNPEPKPIKTPDVIITPVEKVIEPTLIQDKVNVDISDENRSTQQQTFEKETKDKEVLNPSNSSLDNPSNITPDQIVNFFKSQNNTSDAPPILKMMVNDITIEDISANSIQIGVSNSIFLAQLNSQKLNLWITQKLSDYFGRPLKIEPKVRDSNKSTPSTQVVKPDIVQESRSSYNTTPRNTSNFSDTSTKPKKDHNNPGIFYEVYNTLPANVDPEKVKVFKGEIPKPEQGENWDDHADELFDFE
jgi:DNA polymerase III subunit gamma/tau